MSRIPSCPRCRDRHLRLTEVCEEWGHIEQLPCGALRSYVDDGPETLSFEPGLVTEVRAACVRCGHTWRIRRMVQITDHPVHAWNLQPNETAAVDGEEGP